MSALSQKNKDGELILAAKEAVRKAIERQKQKHPAGSEVWYDSGSAVRLQSGICAGTTLDAVAVIIPENADVGVLTKYKHNQDYLVHVPWSLAYTRPEALELQAAFNRVQVNL